MKSSEIYREAARRFETGEAEDFSCQVIDALTGLGVILSPQRVAYEDMFKSDGLDGYAWLDSAVDYGLIAIDEMRDWRITALCFMAAISEDEGD